jgi:hypothetical protein
LTPVGKRVARVFDLLLDEVNEHYPLRACVFVADATHFPEDRSFAYCETRPVRGVYRIGVAPKLESQPASRIIALLMHELAHAVLLFQGIADHSERDADKVAEAIFDMQISYDEMDVQTLKKGRRPRPSHLPHK